MNEHKALGKRKKGTLKRLEEEIENDPAWQEVLAHVEPDSQEFKLKLAQCDAASALANAVLCKRGIHAGTGLIRRDSLSTYYALDSILYALNVVYGEIEAAKKLVHAVESNCGKINALIRPCTGRHKDALVADNALLAIVYRALGRIKDSDDILEQLSKTMMNLSGSQQSLDYAAMFFADSAIDGVASVYLDWIEQKVGYGKFKEDKLMLGDDKAKNPLVTANALLSAGHFMRGNYGEGELILRSIKHMVDAEDHRDYKLYDLIYVFHSARAFFPFKGRLLDFQPHTNLAMAVAERAKEYQKNERPR
jgi:hypothetical protein